MDVLRAAEVLPEYREVHWLPFRVLPRKCGNTHLELVRPDRTPGSLSARSPFADPFWTNQSATSSFGRRLKKISDRPLLRSGDVRSHPHVMHDDIPLCVAVHVRRP